MEALNANSAVKWLKAAVNANVKESMSIRCLVKHFNCKYQTDSETESSYKVPAC